MRREKTYKVNLLVWLLKGKETKLILKVCANHSIFPWMDLKPNCGSKKAWCWKTGADFADEEIKSEVCLI